MALDLPNNIGEPMNHFEKPLFHHIKSLSEIWESYKYFTFLHTFISNYLQISSYILDQLLVYVVVLNNMHYFTIPYNNNTDVVLTGPVT